MKILKGYQRLRVWWYRLLSTNEAEMRNCKVRQPLLCVGKGRVVLESVQLGYWPSPDYFNGCIYIEARESSAQVRVGAGTVLNNGAAIIAERGCIDIGRNCLIGRNLSVVDSDFHGLSVVERRSGKHPVADVRIGDEVFIGNDVALLKGVSVGAGAVIGSGAIVVRDVEPNAIYAGNPARLIRYLDEPDQ